MNVLILHNAYQHLGGEDTVVRRETELLERHGDIVTLHIVSNNHISGLRNKVVVALGVLFSLESYRSVRKLIRQSQPHVVHVHNFFPLLSPSVFYACHAEHVPVVFTLHNYRIVCPTALLMHEGKVTERSIQQGPWWALRHRVYRDSWVGTFLLCSMIWLHRRIGTWQRKVDCFIALTEFGKERVIAAGLPPEKIMVKPNFADIQNPINELTRYGLLFVGRLSPEKGIETLLEAAALPNGDVIRNALRLLGEGPLSERVLQSGITWLGAMKGDEVLQQMQTACALIMPSIWYETFGLVIVEAYASGLPVIASRIGALAELIEDGVTGMLFEPGNAADLAEKAAWALSHPDEMRRMGRAARQRYEERYTGAQNYKQLIAIYQEAIEGQNAHAK